jgi:hypothetical protein
VPPKARDEVASPKRGALARVTVSDDLRVNWLGRHTISLAVVVVALAAVGAVFAFARPTYRPYVMPDPPDHGLPYSVASYAAADARRAFAAEGIKLSPRSQSTIVTTLGNQGDILEVDTFADRAKVEKAGFWDYTVANGHYVHFPPACAADAPSAERWHGNVRVIVDCPAAGTFSSAWLRRAERALARL